MKTGLIGGSLSGKTTLFNAMTNSQAAVGTGSRELHISNVKVPDKRIDKLTEVYKPKKTTYAEFDFVDFPSGFDSKTEAQTVAKVREQDCLGLVLGAYQAGTEKELVNELNNVLSEIILLDLVICERRMNRLERENKKDLEYQTMARCKEYLEKELFLYKLEFGQEEEKLISAFRFLSRIPIILLANLSEDDFNNKKNFPLIEKICQDKGLDYLYLSGKLEMEISLLPREDQALFLRELDLSESAGDRFLRKAYENMNLISFFTSGSDEVRAWTIRKDTIAQKAAGKIHSDIERGFIRAEVFSYDDFIANDCDEGTVKAKGRFRLEGKSYLVQDGDIISYRFNV
jgi:hypothetical protein